MKIAGTTINLGQSRYLEIDIAKLVSGTKINMPVYISRGKQDGPVLLLMAGLHGDEINSVDVIRQIIDEKINQVDRGTVICIPIVNIFGFINFSREVPDGKDVNRSFPGSQRGSLASQIARALTDNILPHCDCVVDFHTGGKSRYNVPQVRAKLDNEQCQILAKAFNAPYTLHSNLIAKSLRETAMKNNKAIIVFEGGESLRFDQYSTQVAIDGTKNLLSHLNMKTYDVRHKESKVFYKRKWIRAPMSGFFHPQIKAGQKVTKNQIIGHINGPLLSDQKSCVSTTEGEVVTLNNNPMVNRGDAIIQIAY